MRKPEIDFFRGIGWITKNRNPLFIAGAGTFAAFPFATDHGDVHYRRGHFFDNLREALSQNPRNRALCGRKRHERGAPGSEYQRNA